MGGDEVPMTAYERPELKELGKVSAETLQGSGPRKGGDKGGKGCKGAKGI